MIQEISQIKQKEIIKGFNGRFFHTNNFTIAFWEIQEGSLLPEHAHIHEQTTQVIEGKLELVIDGVTTVLELGMIANIPSNVIHSGKALTNCKVTDVFSPTREDYK
ncbi:MAG: cupin domain-containing protein [Lutibacter sp.]